MGLGNTTGALPVANGGTGNTIGAAQQFVSLVSDSNSTFRNVWFGANASSLKAAYDTDFQYNPSTNILNVQNINGTSITISGGLTSGGTIKGAAASVSGDITATNINATNLNVTNLVLFRPILWCVAENCTTVTATNGEITLTANVENGAAKFEIPDYDSWIVSCKNSSNQIFTQTVNVSEVKIYRIELTKVYRYGYRISKTEGDPYERVEYLFDAVGMTPAHMDFTNGVFDYGSWADVWFVADNKPLMLKNDGTVDYYLNPNDYSLKEDGTASDVDNLDYEGNAMAQIPLCWISRYEDADYCYEIVSNVQYDETYKAYAHTRADGSIADYLYYSLFDGSYISNKIRSIANQNVAKNFGAQTQINGALSNGDGWYIHSWSQRELIRTLLILLGKSTNVQAVFGRGNTRNSTSSNAYLATGNLINKGQFFGYNNSTSAVKVFHIENFWGNQTDRTAGVINDHGKVYVKMTPEGSGYRISDVLGMTEIAVLPVGSRAYIKDMLISKFGMIPIAVGGSSSTYYPDGFWANANGFYYLNAGGSAYIPTDLSGAFAFEIANTASNASYINGCGISFV